MELVDTSILPGVSNPTPWGTHVPLRSSLLPLPPDFHHIISHFPRKVISLYHHPHQRHAPPEDILLMPPLATPIHQVHDLIHIREDWLSPCLLSKPFPVLGLDLALALLLAIVILLLVVVVVVVVVCVCVPFHSLDSGIPEGRNLT